jgi:hypothetical protein
LNGILLEAEQKSLLGFKDGLRSYFEIQMSFGA